MSLGERAYKCRDCRLWNDGIGYPEDQEFITYLLPNGMKLSVPGVGDIPLHSEFVLCPTHLKETDDAVPA